MNIVSTLAEYFFIGVLVNVFGIVYKTLQFWAFQYEVLVSAFYCSLRISTFYKHEPQITKKYNKKKNKSFFLLFSWCMNIPTLC